MTKAEIPPEDTHQLTNIQKKQLLIDAIPESTRAAEEKEYLAGWEEALIELERKDKRKQLLKENEWLKRQNPNNISEMDQKRNILKEQEAELAKIDGNQTEDDRERSDEQNRDADNKQTVSISDYIKQRRTDGEKDEIIAHELHDKNGNFKLTYANIATEFGLDNGLNNGQFDARKQRGKRFCEKGKAMLEKKLR